MPPNPDRPAEQAEAASQRFAAGAFIDHYCIIRPLGSGGMADVFLARDTHLGRKVAIKVVQKARLKSKDAVERFLFEARTTARFNHPHIVTVYQVGETDGCPYLVLEYVEGQSLRVAAHLGGWTREWVAARTEACEATAVSGTQSERVLDLRMGCLERKFRSLQALVGVFAGKPDGQVVDKAVEAALGLGGIAFCADVKALGPDHPDVAHPMVGLALTCEKQNRLAEALPLLERAIAIRLKAAVSTEERAEAAFSLARVLRALGKDRARARSLAQEALELYQAAGPGAEKDRREVERWLTEHKGD